MLGQEPAAAIDPVSTLQRADDPEALFDYRTPGFDLDCLYGRGPNDQPYLYERDGVRLALGAPLIKPDLAGDLPDGYDLPRNDENVIIAQLHSIFMRFHNRLRRRLRRPWESNHWTTINCASVASRGPVPKRGVPTAGALVVLPARRGSTSARWREARVSRQLHHYGTVRRIASGGRAFTPSTKSPLEIRHR